MTIKEALTTLLNKVFDKICEIDEVDDYIDEIILDKLMPIITSINKNDFTYDEYTEDYISSIIREIIAKGIDNQDVLEINPYYMENLLIVMLIILKYPNITTETQLSSEFKINKITENSLLKNYSMNKIGIIDFQTLASNSSDVGTSCIIFVNSISNEEKLLEFCGEISKLSPEYFYMILDKCFERPDYFFDEGMLFIHNIIDDESAEALFLLNNLALEKIASPIIEYKRTPTSLSFIKKAISRSDKNKPYRQYSKIFKVINDYNSVNGYLEKYLKLYHIYEELMVRINIVKLMKTKHYTVREISELHTRESEDLKRLIDIILRNTTIQKDINDYWSNNPKALQCFYSIIRDKIDDNHGILKNIRTNHGTGATEIRIDSSFALNNDNKGEIKSILAELIYSIRNGIVHNKAAENHITYSELNNDGLLREFINEFLIPCMEIMIFDIMIIFPGEFKYNNNKIEVSLFD